MKVLLIRCEAILAECTFFIKVQAVLERNSWNPEVANVILKTSSNMEYILDNSV